MRNPMCYRTCFSGAQVVPGWAVGKFACKSQRVYNLAVVVAVVEVVVVVVVMVVVVVVVRVSGSTNSSSSGSKK